MGAKREKRHYRKVDLSNLRRESYKELTPGVQTQYRDLSLEYFRLADETRAAFRRLFQYQKDHPELFPLHWS